MTIGWIIFGIVAVATSILGVFVYTKKRGTIRASIGRGLKTGRRTLFRRNVTASKRAIKHRRTSKRNTPRGKIRAKRKAQPPGLIVPHVRRADDPRVTTKLARKAKARVVVARAMHKQRKSDKRANARLAIAMGTSAGKPAGSLTGTERQEGLRAVGLCGYPTQDKGYCQNRARQDRDTCRAGHPLRKRAA